MLNIVLNYEVIQNNIQILDKLVKPIKKSFLKKINIGEII
jgi:hypothetical protein